MNTKNLMQIKEEMPAATFLLFGSCYLLFIDIEVYGFV
mgnify:CR=1 FL=1